MAAIAFAAALPTIYGAVGTAAGITIAVAGGILAAYIDQALIYPALFGKKDQKPASLEGFQISTTDPGAPRWEVYGSRAWVPCHYIWSLNIKEELAGGSGGNAKGGGGRPFVQTIRADVGLATCDGPIKEIDTLYGDERVFWSRQFNRIVYEEHRLTITAGTGAETGLLIVEASANDVQDFTGVFIADDKYEFVRLESVQPLSLLGFYRTVSARPHGGGLRTRLVLRPLQGQTPTAGVAGSPFEPARIRIMYSGVATNQWNVSNCFIVSGPTFSQITLRSSNTPGSQFPTTGLNDLEARFPVGGIFRFANWNSNGRYRCIGTSFEFFPWGIVLESMDGQALPDALSALANLPPLVVYRDEVGGFVFYDDQQRATTYSGTLDQPADPTLALTEPNPPAHRGIAHVSLSKWNLGPHGNIFPRATSMVRARLGETVGAGLKRICMRTMEEGQSDVSVLRPKTLLGYSIPGGMTGGQAVQPLLAMHGIAIQERGGVLTFLDERDLPVVAVATRHLNARGNGEATTTRGFVAKRIEKADVPERVLLQYLDPSEGADEAEGSGNRAPGGRSRGGRDTLLVNLKPLVVWPFEAKRRARELHRKVTLETYSGQTRLPPGYMDVLPGHVLTFSSNNQEEEYAAGATAIAHDLRLRDILPRTMVVEVRFVGGQRAALVDDGNGHLQGFPAGITASVNTVNYGTGRIDLTCSTNLDTTEPPLISYQYEKQWLMRVNRATLSGFDFTVPCELVTTTRDDPLPPLPRSLRTGLGGAIASVVPLYRTHILDLPPLYPNQGRSVWIPILVAPEPGAAWRGATIYQSPNGVDRWSPIGQVQTPSIMGSMPTNVLPTTLTGATLGVIDWSTELVVDLPNGDVLEDATTEQIGFGTNWLLVGDEIIAFHEADSGTGTTWTLRGLIRGMRHTHLAIDTHADGDRVVLLTGLGATNGLYYEPQAGFASAGLTYNFRVVPGGASIDQVETITRVIRGRSALPPPPVMRQDLLTVVAGSHIDVRWDRRSYDQTSVFGALPFPPGEWERYEVIAFDIAAALALVATLGIDAAIDATRKRRWVIGSPVTGTPLVDHQLKYTNSEITADGFAGGAAVGFVTYQVSSAGRSDRSDIVFATPA